MLYIEKEGLSNDINRKIIELSKSEEWKSIGEDDTTAIRNAFDNDFPKNEVKEILLHEQHGICAYCMRRIRMDNHSRVEHLVPLSRNKDMAIDYNNMLGVCDGGEKVTGDKGHILCCDAHKKEIEILLHFYLTDKEKFINYFANNFSSNIDKVSGLLSYINSVDSFYISKLRKKYGSFIVNSFIHRDINVKF